MSERPTRPAETIAVGAGMRRAALAADQLQLRVADADDRAGADEDLAEARALVERAVLRVEVGDAHAVAEHLELEVAARDLGIAQRQRAIGRRADEVALALVELELAAGVGAAQDHELERGRDLDAGRIVVHRADGVRHHGPAQLQ